MNMLKKQEGGSLVERITFKDTYGNSYNRFLELESANYNLNDLINSFSKEVASKLEEKNNLKKVLKENEQALSSMKGEALIVSLEGFKNVNNSIFLLKTHLAKLDKDITGIESMILYNDAILKENLKEINKLRKELANFGKLINIKDDQTRISKI